MYEILSARGGVCKVRSAVTNEVEEVTSEDVRACCEGGIHFGVAYVVAGGTLRIVPWRREKAGVSAIVCADNAAKYALTNKLRLGIVDGWLRGYECADGFKPAVVLDDFDVWRVTDEVADLEWTLITYGSLSNMGCKVLRALSRNKIYVFGKLDTIEPMFFSGSIGIIFGSKTIMNESINVFLENAVGIIRPKAFGSCFDGLGTLAPSVWNKLLVRYLGVRNDGCIEFRCWCGKIKGDAYWGFGRRKDWFVPIGDRVPTCEVYAGLLEFTNEAYAKAVVLCMKTVREHYSGIRGVRETMECGYWGDGVFKAVVEFRGCVMQAVQTGHDGVLRRKYNVFRTGLFEEYESVKYGMLDGRVL